MLTPVPTDRLIIDQLTIEDHDFILELVNSAGWLEFIGSRNVHSKEDAINFIHKTINSPNLTYWVVRLKVEEIPIGIISFIKRAYLEHFDIGFAFLPQFAGQGFAFEAANEVLLNIRRKPEHSSILATTVPQNVHSIRLLTKLGFHFEKEIEVENEKIHVYSNQTTI
jgi:ribosomal-protein-alanine N-acetyltransferase